MAIMIPPVISNSAPVSEKMIFETFKPPIEGRHWEVLHSVTRSSYEFDFVILIPTYLSVICLEVVTKEQLYSPIGAPVSPLLKGEQAMRDLRSCFSHSYFRANSPLALGYAVAFPAGIQLNEQTLPEYLAPMFNNTELPEHLALMTGRPGNCDALDPESLAKELESYAIDLCEWERIGTDAEWKKAQAEMDELRSDLVLTGTTIAKIFHDSLGTQRPQLLRLTDDQHKSLKQIENKTHCVIDGAAGTGKTVLAIEVAKRRWEAGETVALMCSNPNLSHRFDKWAETLPKGSGGRIVVGTPATLPLWAFAENDALMNRHQRRLDDSPDLEKTLKLGALDDRWEAFIDNTLADLEQKSIFNYLIVDEAQNLCDSVFLKLMNALLKGGLANGHWNMFGDFTNQRIVSLDRNGTQPLKNYGWSDDKLVKLETNCRNTHEITDKVVKLVGIESLPMSGVHGPHAQIKYFGSQEKLEDILDNLIHDWDARGFQSRQIILLSSVTGREFNTEREYSGWRLLNINEATEEAPTDPETFLRPGGPSQGNMLRYSDVYDFQGLESDLAILVLPVTEEQVKLGRNISLRREKHLNRVLYTGMSRAKTMLVIVAHETYKGILERREYLYDQDQNLCENDVRL